MSNIKILINYIYLYLLYKTYTIFLHTKTIILYLILLKNEQNVEASFTL